MMITMMLVKEMMMTRVMIMTVINHPSDHFALSLNTTECSLQNLPITVGLFGNLAESVSNAQPEVYPCMKSKDDNGAHLGNME